MSKRPDRAHCPHTPHPRAARFPRPYQRLHSVYTGAQAPHSRQCAAGRTPRADPSVPCGAHRGSLPRCSPARRDHTDGPVTLPASTQLLPPTHSRDMTPASRARRAQRGARGSSRGPATGHVASAPGARTAPDARRRCDVGGAGDA